MLVKTAVVMADCIHLPSSNAKRRLFGCRWDEKSVDFLKSRSKQLSRLFHPDKVTSWAHRLHLVAPDLSCFVQAQAALNKHKGISERKKTVRELELSAENWWRQAKAFDEKIAEGEHCKMKDLIQQRRQASREARLVWTEMLRVLDESAVTCVAIYGNIMLFRVFFLVNMFNGFSPAVSSSAFCILLCGINYRPSLRPMELASSRLMEMEVAIRAIRKGFG